MMEQFVDFSFQHTYINEYWCEVIFKIDKIIDILSVSIMKTSNEALSLYCKYLNICVDKYTINNKHVKYLFTHIVYTRYSWKGDYKLIEKFIMKEFKDIFICPPEDRSFIKELALI